MTLVIPSKAKGPFATLLTYPEEKLEAIATAMEKLNPSLSMEDLARQISENAQLEFSAAKEMLDVLLNAYLLPEFTSIEREDLVSELTAAMVKAGSATYSPAGDNWDPARRFLGRMLSENSLVGLIAKAFFVSAGHERTFCEASIFTDLRPIFRSPEDPPAAFLATHSLRITYHHGASTKREDVYVVLNRADLDQLEALIARARLKEDQLRKVTVKGDTLFLEAKP